jgi:hypothetical protein
MTQPAGPPPTSGTGGGSFTVDITRAPQAIRELEQALEDLRSIRLDAMQLAQVNPPAADQVSADAARTLGLKANGEPGSFLPALEAGIAEVERMIESLNAGFDAYEEGDVQASSRLSVSL